MKNGKTVPVIAIIGGTTSGKTSLMVQLLELIKHGFHPIIIGEIATRIFSSHISPKDFSVYDLQKLIIREGLSTEKNFRELLRNYQGSLKPIIITDRGVPDTKAYCNPGDYEKILSELGYTQGEVLSRYTAVVYLQTIAATHQEVFKKVFLSNPHRVEVVWKNGAKPEDVVTEDAIDWDATKLNALASDQRVLDAWNGSSKIYQVPNCLEFEDKKKSFLNIVLGILGIPTPIEKEYKFLLSKDFSLGTLYAHHVTVSPVEITQHYLTETPMRSSCAYPVDAYEVVERIRSRKFGQYTEYIYTLKARVADSIFPYEVEHLLTSDSFIELLNYRDEDKRAIKKTRYYFIYKGQNFELDVFTEPIDEHGTLMLLELETPHETYELPEFLGVVTDVTTNLHYKNDHFASKSFKKHFFH
jgi:CYTH domain-containing protein